MKTLYLMCGRLICSAFFLLLSLSVQAQTFYVKKSGGSDANSGTTWASAFQNLNKALAEANLVAEGTAVEIHVAAGVYKPDEAYTGVQVGRRQSFELYRGDGLNKSLKIYGGYPASATNGATANPGANPTYLDGDIGTAGDKVDNSYHVAIIFQQDVEAEILFEGFTIRNGYANGINGDEGNLTFYGANFIRNENGAGLVVDRARSEKITIKNCLITENTSYDPGSGGSAGATFGDTKAKIENCTFSNNNANDTFFGSGGVGVGGEVQFLNCHFENNKGNNGGAAAIEGSNQSFTNCSFTGNESLRGGGAIAMNQVQESTMITGCTFTNNKAVTGGAISSNASSPQISQCKFEGNEASGDAGAVYCNGPYPSSPQNISKCTFTSNKAGGHGGAINIQNLAFGTISSCIFDGNTASGGNSNGGAMYMSLIGLSIENNVFLNNSATQLGGALFEDRPVGGAGIPRAKLINSTFHNNSATSGGAYYHSNEQGYIESNPEGLRLFSNNIFWNNGDEIINSDPAAPAPVTYSIVEGGYTGTGNLDTDPLFKNEADPDGPDNILGTIDDGIQLLVCSPAVDAGTATDAPATDILGNARFNGDGQNGAETDMGAYESQTLQNPPRGVISGTSEICPGGSTPLVFTLSNGTAPFVVVYTNGTDQFTLNDYASGTSVAVSPSATTTYSLVSITDANKCEATSLTGSAVVTVLTSPFFSTTPSDRSTDTNAGLCTAAVNYTAEAGGSNTALHPLTLSYALTGATTGSGSGTGNGLAYNKGITTVTVTLSNGCSPDAIHTFNITVTDNQNPVLTAAANQNVSINASCAITIPDLVSSSSAIDNCAGTVITQSPLAGSTTPASRNETIEVTITATDAAGLTDVQTVTLTAKDVTAPNVPSLPIVHGICSATVPSPTTSDNCGGPVPGTTSDPTSYTDQGTFTVSWTFTDLSGNESTATQTVIVSDTELPTITAPANIVTTNNNGCNAAGVIIGMATSGDNCGVASTTNDGPGVYPIGVTTVIWTATDVNGNTATATQTVTVLATVLAIAGDEVSHPLSFGADDLYATDCRVVARILPSGASPVSGDLNAKVYIDETVPASHPYVTRHYDLSPVSGAETATATITLYFLQQEFTEYNTRAGSELLPSGPSGNKSNLYINQFHGTSETGAVGSYSGTSVPPFHPANENIVWNSAYSRWEVTFNVNGFSGFFVTGSSSSLPVTLTSMAARAVENSAIEIRWSTSQEVDFDHFELERTEDPKKAFAYLATIKPDTKDASGKYLFADQSVRSGATQYYRLKMLDLDGTYAYSKIVSAQLGIADLEITAYPSPATDILTIRASGIISGFKLINNAGITILDREIWNETNLGRLDLTKYQSGIYQLLVRLKDGREMYKKVLLVR